MIQPKTGKALEREQNKAIKKIKRFFKKNSRLPNREELRGMEISETYMTVYFGDKDKMFDKVGKLIVGSGGRERLEEEETRSRMLAISKRYARWCKREGRMVEAEEAGITIYYVRSLFNNLAGLKEFTRREYPDYLKSIIDYTVYNDERANNLKRLVGNSKRFIISTAVEGAPVFESFFDSIKKFCKSTGSVHLIIPSVNDMGSLDTSLSEENIVFDDVQLNNQLYISSIKVPPKMINPSTGLNKLSKGNRSFILSSPKQILEVIAQPKGEHQHPRIIATTGALTLPSYHGRKFVQNRTDTIADTMHTCGAMIVEIESANVFHYRHVQALADGSFIDLGKRYTGSSVTQVPESIFIMGDLHWGRHSEKVVNCWERIIKRVKSKKVFIHDLFDFLSICHHDSEKRMTRARRHREGLLSLQTELDSITVALDRFSSITDEVAIVKSNHDLFLDRYLEDGKFIDDPQNLIVSLDLAKSLATGEDPLEEYYSSRLRYPGRVRFMQEDLFRKEYGITISCHGHRGVNGGRGSLESLANALGRVIIGHSHAPAMGFNSYRVGYSGGNHDYAKGPSSWLACSAVAYPGGSVQLINSIRGKFCLDDRG